MVLTVEQLREWLDTFAAGDHVALVGRRLVVDHRSGCASFDFAGSRRAVEPDTRALRATAARLYPNWSPEDAARAFGPHDPRAKGAR
jgi:hypothetical protein